MVYHFINDRMIIDVRKALFRMVDDAAVDFVLNSTSDIIADPAPTVQREASRAVREAEHFPPAALDAVREVLSRS
jgi:hypothetical protein